MEEWLRVFQRTRDFGLAPSRALQMRLKSESPVFDYNVREQLHEGLWNAGHIRAALMSAAADRNCLYVDIPLPFSLWSDVSEFRTKAYYELVDGNFAPATFDVRVEGGVSVLTVSLYTETEVRLWNSPALFRREQ